LLIVFLIAALLPYPVGSLLSFFYSIAGDSLKLPSFRRQRNGRSQSIGKKIMHLQVIHIPDHQPAKLMDSLLRNSPIGVATFFAIIPIWGWIIWALIGIPLLLMEIYLMASVETGHRLGDVIADTEVIEI
jgi:hypothetical protein